MSTNRKYPLLWAILYSCTVFMYHSNAKDICDYYQSKTGIPLERPPDSNISISLKLQNNAEYFIPNQVYKGE